MAIRSLKTGQFSRSALVGNPVIMPGSYESIATVTVGSGGTGSITFSSIPQTFTHLQIRFIARGNGSANLRVNFNGNGSNSNYAYHALRGDGSTTSTLAFASGVDNALNIANEVVPTAANIFGVGVIDILDYANTNKYKTSRVLGGHDTNGAGYVTFNSNLWMNTSAITSVELINPSATLQQYSHFALYGVN